MGPVDSQPEVSPMDPSTGQTKNPRRGDAALPRLWLFAVAACLLSMTSPSMAHLGHSDTEQVVGAPGMAPGYSSLRFDAPEPGSYTLPPIRRAADGPVLDSDGSPRTLHELFDDRFVLLSFIYTHCDDVNGCPLSTFVMHRVRQTLERHPELADEVRLISLSFDPEVDTPDVMRRYGEDFESATVDWNFVTTESNEVLQPLLDSYGQGVTREYDAGGAYLGHISHVLRVYLIDRERRIRNIYNVSFLHPDLIMADLHTLREEAGEAGPRTAGEDRTPELRTDALLAQLRKPPTGLPTPPLPEGKLPTAAQVDLGRKLFFDRRLSANGTLACAMCHIPEQGFAQNHMARSIGVEGHSLRRNAMSLFNVAYFNPLFADARELSLETLAWQEFLDEHRMGNASVAMVIDQLRQAPDYTGLFEEAFDGGAASMESVASALAAWMRTLVSADAPFDRWRYAGDSGAIDASAQRGFELFTGKAGCAACHTVGETHALFTDNELHNTGIGWFQSMGRAPKASSIEIAPGLRIEIDRAALTGTEEARFNDLGYYEVTQNPADRWKFRTPSLRNVTLTAPYMHDGSLPDLESVVDYYDRGGHPHPELDPRVKPLGLDDGERADLVAFLESLTGDNLPLLLEDAAAANIATPGGYTRQPGQATATASTR